MTMTEAVADPEEFPDDPREFREFLLVDLVIDADIQRATDPDRVHRICREFRWALFEVPTVVDLGDGRAKVVEGQHRVLALRRLAPVDLVVTCAVLPLSTSNSEQAGVAYAITKGRRAHSALASWELRRLRGDAHEVAAEGILDERGLRLGARPSAMTVAAVETVSSIIHGKRRTPEYGAILLAAVLDVLGAAFVADEEARGARWDGRLMRAVCSILVDNPTADDERLVAVLRAHDAAYWLHAAAQPVQPAWLHLRAMFVQQYNGRRVGEERIS